MSDQRLKKGMHVEVTSDEDGFRGAWYIARIVKAPKSEDYYVVEYKEFVNEDDDSKKLIERVHVSSVRPLPPVGKGINEVIEVNDVVDAFHNDGWWSGVVDVVVDGGKKFVVCFDDPPDKMECKRSDVRPHFDWVRGQWVKPLKKDFRGHSNSMLCNNSENYKRQKRRAKRQQARIGCTSTEKKDRTGVPDDIIEKECTIEVDMSDKEVEVALSAKQCGTPPKKDQMNKSRDQEIQTVDSTNVSTKGDNGLKRKRGRPKLLTKKQIGEGSTGFESSLQKTVKAYSCVGDEAEISAEKHCLMHTTVDKPNRDPDSMMVNADKKFTSGVNRHSDLLSETAIIPLDQEDETVVIKRIKRHKNSLSIADNEMRKIVDSDSRHQEKKDRTGVPDEIIEKECTAEVDMSDKEVEGALPAKHCGTSPKKDQMNRSRDQEIHTVDSTNVSTKGDNSLKRKRGRPKLLSKKQIGEGCTGSESSLRRTVKTYSCVGDEAEISAEKHSLMHTTVDKPNEDPDSKMVTADKKCTSGVNGHSDLLGETAIIPLDQTDETVVIKRTKRRKNSLSIADNEMSKIVDSDSRSQECDNASRGDSSVHEINHAKDADMMIDVIPVGYNIDQVSNSRIQLNKPSPTGSDDSRALPVQHQCADANGMPDDYRTAVAKKDRMEPCPIQKTDHHPNPGDLPVQSFIRADSNDKGGELGTLAVGVNVENNQSLPFVKDSPLWTTIESMEIFKKIPKKPHFSPLLKCREESREGLAIGHMVNFSNLGIYITKLQFRDPITIMESKLETLAELESHGFDVETTRACLTQLLSKKQREQEFEKEYQDVGNKISNSVEEISKVDEEITELNKKIEELAAKLDDAVSRKDMKVRMISALQTKQDMLSGNVQRLQLEFQNITGSQ